MSALIKQLEIARQDGDLSDIAFYFAELLGRLDPTAGDPLRLAAALVSQRTGSGHVCVYLPDEAEHGLLTTDNELNITAPPLAEWMAVLKKSTVVTMSGEYRPLVLEPDGRLYLYRYWDWEKRLAEDLLVRAQLPDLDIDDNALSQALTAVFPAGLGSSDQKVAAALSVFSSLECHHRGSGKRQNDDRSADRRTVAGHYGHDCRCNHPGSPHRQSSGTATGGVRTVSHSARAGKPSAA